MPGAQIWVPEGTVGTTASPVDMIERPCPDIKTVTTADPGSGGTTLAVTNTFEFPSSNNFKVYVIGTSGTGEIMLVTSGAGTNSWTVTRGQDGTTGVAHSSGAAVYLMTSVQRVQPVDASKIVTYKGRAMTFKTLGRAGTTGQKIFAIHNATASKVLVEVEKVYVDVMQTAARVVEPPAIRLWRFTAVPTNGSAVTKVPDDSALTSSSSVTLWQDSSADSTGSGTTLTVTLPSATVVGQTWGARALTLVGYEQYDREIFLETEEENLLLRPLEGLCVFLDYTAATANPVTDKWLVGCRWTEYLATD